MSSNQGGSTVSSLILRHATEPFVAKRKRDHTSGSVMSILTQSPEYSLFTDMIIKSGYYEMLDNPDTRVSIFAPRNAVFMDLSQSNAKNINRVDVRTLVGYHITDTVLDKESMMHGRFMVKTKSDILLEINGLGLIPKVGEFHKSLPQTSSDFVVSSVSSSIPIGKSIINVVELPLIPHHL